MFSSFDMTNLRGKPMAETKNKGKIVVLFDKTTGEAPVWQLNTDKGTFHSKFGVGDFDKEKSKRNLDITIGDPCLVSFLGELDEWVLTTAIANSEEWFKKKMERQGVEDLFAKTVRERDGEQLLRIKVGAATDVSPTEIGVIKDLERMEYYEGGIDDLTRGVDVVVTVRPQYLWFMQSGKAVNFGVTLVATSILAIPPKRKGRGISSLVLSKAVVKAARPEEDVVAEAEAEEDVDY